RLDCGAQRREADAAADAGRQALRLPLAERVLEDRPQEAFLRAEPVADEASAVAGFVADRLQRRAIVAALGDQPPRGRHQAVLGERRAFGLRPVATPAGGMRRGVRHEATRITFA